MIANVENTIKWLQLSNLQDFSVSLTDKNNSFVFRSDDDATFETNLNRFRDAMDVSSGGRYFIKGRVHGDKSQHGWHTEWFANQPQNAAPASIAGTPGAPMVGYVGIDEMERRLTEERQRIMNDIRIKQLEDENKELKDDLRAKETVTHRFMETLNPYIGDIAGSLAGKFLPRRPVIGVAGIEPATDNSQPEPGNPQPATDNSQLESDSERLESALARFAAAEPDFIKIIETLASMAETQDGTYLMAKGMLIK